MSDGGRTVCLHSIVEYTCINKPKSRTCLLWDALAACVYVCVIMCQWCRTVAITRRQRGLPDGVSVVQEGRCAAFIKLTVPGSQERLTHCGWGMAEQGMQPHAPLYTKSHQPPSAMCALTQLTLDFFKANSTIDNWKFKKASNSQSHLKTASKIILISKRKLRTQTPFTWCFHLHQTLQFRLIYM